MKKFYRLWISDEEGNERFSLMSDKKDYLKERGDEWVRLNFIKSFYVTEHEEKES